MHDNARGLSGVLDEIEDDGRDRDNALEGLGEDRSQDSCVRGNTECSLQHSVCNTPIEVRVNKDRAYNTFESVTESLVNSVTESLVNSVDSRPICGLDVIHSVLPLR
ncbi:hypothetical protein BGZ49_003149 [Haplosporangium sp. Z 27]|nr:hypothetical protein BGZ49_003149 [Haplosporangium sp. Z 27]